MGDRAGSAAACEFRESWPTLAGAALGLASGALTIFYYTQGLFLAPLGAEFGWSRSQLALISLVGGFVIAGASVAVGGLVDRFGTCAPALAAYAVVALAFVGLSASGPSFPLFMTLQLLVIAFGAASGPANYTRAVNQSFEQAKGMALGLVFAAVGVAALAAPPLVAWIIQTWGWRAGYAALAGITALGGPLALLLLSIRRRPAQVRAGRPAAGGPSQSLSQSPSLGRALADPVYLRLLAAFALMALGAGGLVLHLAPVLTDEGYDMVAAARVQGVLGVSMLIGRLVVGYLVDRLFAPRVAAVTAVLAAGGLGALAAFGAQAALPAAVLVGLALGAEGDVVGYVTARYFGLAAYGRLYGLLYGAYTVGLGGGGFVMARLQAASGDYGPSLYAGAAAMLAGAALLHTAPPFARKGS